MPLLVAASPTLLTVLTGAAGVWDPGDVTRALAGVPLGALVGAVLAAVVLDDLR